MNLFDYLHMLYRQCRLPAEKAAAAERIEEGRKDGTIKPYLGSVIEDDCGLPEGMVRTCEPAKWRCDA